MAHTVSQGLLEKLRGSKDGAVFVVESLTRSLSNPRIQGSFQKDIHDCHALIAAIVQLGREITDASLEKKKADWEARLLPALNLSALERH